ncbi:MAG: sulfite exporter TauE/SafE family protein [candidate division Zixibacteria bacterium]|nr:sulfite exporter TauE/SafE family protein [candidate division Zixibacteria bacterium]
MYTFPISGVETYWWLPGLVAFVISFFTSMGGLSGAFILMPFQISILGFSSPAVTPTNLVYNVFSIPGGVYRFIREKRMIWPLMITIIIGTLPGLVIGAYLRVKYLSDSKNFKLFVGIVLLYIVVKLAQGLKEKTRESINNQDFQVKTLKYNLRQIQFNFNGQAYNTSTGLIFLLTLIVGVVGGAYGIGGGAIVSPFLVAVCGLPVYAVAGAALFSTFLSSVMGVIVYSYFLPVIFPGFQTVKPDYLLGLSLGVGGFAGIYLGARFQKYFPSRFIKAILAISLGIVVVKYVGGYFW